MPGGLRETLGPLDPLATCQQVVWKYLVNACQRTYLCTNASLREPSRSYLGYIHWKCLVSLRGLFGGVHNPHWLRSARSLQKWRRSKQAFIKLQQSSRRLLTQGYIRAERKFLYQVLARKLRKMWGTLRRRSRLELVTEGGIIMFLKSQALLWMHPFRSCCLPVSCSSQINYICLTIPQE